MLAEPHGQPGAADAPGGHGERVGHITGGGRLRPGVDVVRQVHGGPVGYRALAVRGAEGGEAEQQNQQAARTGGGPDGGGRGGGRGAHRSRRGAAQQRGTRERGDREAEQSGGREPLGGRQGAGEQAARTGAEQAAEAVPGVEAGHDGAAELADDLDGGAVHGDVRPAVAGAEEQQDAAERGHRVGVRGQRDGDREQGERGDGDRTGAVAQAEPAHDRHGGHGARRHAEQGEAERPVRGADLVADVGDPDDPGGEEQAVDGEEGGQGEPGGAPGGEGGHGDGAGSVGNAARLGGLSVGGGMGTNFVSERHKVRIGTCSSHLQVRSPGPGPNSTRSATPTAARPPTAAGRCSVRRSS